MQPSDADEPAVVIIIDEASALFNQQLAERSDLGEPMLSRAIRELRKRRVGFLLADQTFSLIPSQVTANANIRLAMRTINGSCLRGIAQSMSLTREQVECLPLLERRVGVFQSGDWPQPVMVQITEVPRVSLSEERREMNAYLVSQLHWVRAGASSEPATAGEPRDRQTTRPPAFDTREFWREFLRTVIDRPAWNLSERRAHLGNVAPSTMKRIVVELVTVGYIHPPISLPLGTRGNPPKFVEITEAGCDFVGADYGKARLAGLGKFSTRLIVRLIQERLEREGQSSIVEAYRNGKAADIAIHHQDGNETAIEVESDHSVAHITDNIKKDFDAGFARVIVVAMNGEAQVAIRRRVMAAVEPAAWDRVDVRLLKDMI